MSNNINSNLSKYYKEIFKEIQAHAIKLKLWDSEIGERLNISSISHKEMKVRGIDKGLPHLTGKSRCLGYDSIPVHFLPNCASYEGENNRFSWLEAIFGISRRESKQGGSIIGWKNKKRNDFIRYRFNHMGWLRDEGKGIKFFRQASNLMKNKSFQVMCLQKVIPNWHLQLTDKQLDKIMLTLNALIETRPVTIDYKRVYIPKNNGKYRPLGVPTLPWRIYLHMWNVYIVWWRQGETENQHAYKKSKGILTAWRELYPKLINSNNAYEFDLKGFFDRVNLDYNKEAMINSGIPTLVAEYLRTLNQSIVKLTKVDEIDETEHRKVLFNSDGTPNPNLSDEILVELKNSRNIDKLLKKGYKKQRDVGVPQGASTSCGLSTMNLKELFDTYKKDLVMYADDGIVFPSLDSPEPKIAIPKAGVIKSDEKSYWIKRNGIFERATKFLGLEFIPAGLSPLDGSAKRTYPRLRAATRGGSKLEYDFKLQFLVFLTDLNLEKYLSLKVGTLIKEKFEMFKKVKFEDRIGLLFNSTIGPSIISRMQNNSLDLLEVSDNRLKYGKGSWAWSHFGQYLYDISDYEWNSFIREKIKIWEEIEEIRTLTPKETQKKESLKDLIEFLEERYWDNTLDEPTNSETEALYQEAKDSIFKNVEKTTPKFYSEGTTRFTFLNYRKKWIKLFKELQLNLGNSSSLACDHLSSYLEEGHRIKNWKNSQEVKYLKNNSPIFMNLIEMKEKFELSKSKKKAKLRKKHRKEIALLFSSS